jgi:hypothetical protein
MNKFGGGPTNILGTRGVKKLWGLGNVAELIRGGKAKYIEKIFPGAVVL